MKKMTFLKTQDPGWGPRLKIQTNFILSPDLVIAIRNTRGVNMLLRGSEDGNHVIHIQYAHLVGPKGTEAEIRKTVKGYFSNQQNTL